MVDVDELSTGDLVTTDARPGAVYKVMEIRDKQTFDGVETIFLVERHDKKDRTHTKAEKVFEKDHDDWELKEEVEG